MTIHDAIAALAKHLDEARRDGNTHRIRVVRQQLLKLERAVRRASVS